MKTHKRPFLSHAHWGIILLLQAWFQAGLSPLYADSLTLTGGTELQAVIVREDSTSLTVSTEDGSRTLSRNDIEKIVRDGNRQNLLLLARFARSQKKYSEAYYMYRKLFESNPGLEEAVEGMRHTQKYIIEDGDSTAAVHGYERYFDEAAGHKSDEMLLSENASYTETIMEKLGIVLRPRTGDLLIADVIEASPAHKAGLRINDILVSVGISRAEYMGLYDVASYLSEHETGRIPATIIRTLDVWMPDSEAVSAFDFLGFAGFDLRNENGYVVVDTVRRETQAYEAGLRAKDRILGINEMHTGSMGYNEAQDYLRARGPSLITLRIQRTVQLN